MSHKKIHILVLIIIALFVGACTKSLSDPLPTTPTQVAGDTVTQMPSATSTATAVPQAVEATDTPTITPTAQPVEPTSTPTLQPASPTSTPEQDSGQVAGLWNLADVRYGIHADRLRVVVEMVEARNTVPYYDIKEVENATVPFPTGPDPSWGESRIDLVISDLYGYNSPILAQLPLVPPTNPVVTRIGQYPTFDDARLGFSIGLIKPAEFKIYELTNPVRIVIDVLYPEPEVTPTPTATPGTVSWSQYTNPVFAVSFQYPSHWMADPTYSYPEHGYTRYHGADGFFIINAADGESLDAYTDSEANHKLKPYGSAPTIENITIQGQAARFILPSADQSMPDQAALIVLYPQPVSIGEYSYPFFVMYADVDYIRAIANTVVFDSAP